MKIQFDYLGICTFNLFCLLTSNMSNIIHAVKRVKLSSTVDIKYDLPQQRLQTSRNDFGILLPHKLAHQSQTNLLSDQISKAIHMFVVLYSVWLSLFCFVFALLDIGKTFLNIFGAKFKGFCRMKKKNVNSKVYGKMVHHMYFDSKGCCFLTILKIHFFLHLTFLEKFI